MKSNVKLILIIIFGTLLLLLPSLLRSYHTKIGEQNYFYERILSNNNFKYDDLSFSGREFTYDSGPIYLLLFLNKFFDLEKLLFILPMIFGLIAILLFHFLLKKLKIDEKEMNINLILLIISPMFFYVFTSYNKFTIIIPLILLTLCLFINESKFYKYMSLLFLFLLGFFDYKAIVVALLFIILYLIHKKRFKEFYLPFIISLISLALNFLPKIIKYGINSNIKENYFQTLLSDLGANYGFSIFLIFFLFFGISYLWKSYKYKYLSFYLAFLIMIILTILDSFFIIYFNFLIFYLAAVGINYLMNITWESELIRKLTIILLIFGLLFSSYNSFNAIKNFQPNEDLFNTLIDLKNYGDGIVFSHPNNGIFINSISQKKNFIDTNYDYAPNLKQRYYDMQILFYTRSADKAKELIDKYNIKYILITKEMKEGLVWNNEDEGLLFVLKNSKEFNNIIRNEDIEVWRVK